MQKRQKMIAEYEHTAVEQEQMVPKQKWMYGVEQKHMVGVTISNQRVAIPGGNRFVDLHRLVKAFFLSANNKKVHSFALIYINKAYFKPLIHKTIKHICHIIISL